MRVLSKWFLKEILSCCQWQNVQLFLRVPLRNLLSFEADYIDHRGINATRENRAPQYSNGILMFLCKVQIHLPTPGSTRRPLFYYWRLIFLCSDCLLFLKLLP